ncbi:MAG: UvrD-helicase domain-containing protein, partial [Pseudomonadota bacterium]|nr:UvrD-helicase domain-containing protein [Pseudomonadota bacterium]
MPFAWNSNDLNEEQKNAVFCEGSVFLTACPGSGKTRCLSHKIVHALEHSMASEKRRVVAITYTQKAAEEIHDRISQLVTDTSKLWIGTIHAFCLEWILRPYAIYHEQLKNGFRVINSHDTEEIISEICKSKAGGKVGYYDCGYFYTSSGRHLTSNKSRLHNVISEVLDEYHEQISSRKQIDFELILKFAHDLIQELPSISKLLSSIFSIVLVDEFQDTKEIQYLILATILRAGQGETDCFMVGDANQAIYSSMGGVAMSAAEFGALAGIKFT